MYCPDERMFRTQADILLTLCVVAWRFCAGVVLRPAKIPAPVRSESEIYKLQLLAQQRDLAKQDAYSFESKARDLVAKSQAARATPGKFPFRVPAPGENLILVAPHRIPDSRFGR